VSGESIGNRLGIAAFLLAVAAGVSGLQPFRPEFLPMLFASALGIATLAAFLGSRLHTIATLFVCIFVLAALPAMHGADHGIFTERYPEIWRIGAAGLLLLPILGLFAHAFGDRTMGEFAPAGVSLLLVVIALMNIDLVAPTHVGELRAEAVPMGQSDDGSEPEDGAPDPRNWQARVHIEVHSATSLFGRSIHHHPVSDAIVLGRWSNAPDRAVFCIARDGACELTARLAGESVDFTVEGIDGNGLFHAPAADHNGADGQRTANIRILSPYVTE
jgi:hypothetical protein